MLRDDINNALKDAMKAGDARRVSTLRLVNSSLKNADIEARGQGKPPLTDEDLLSLLQKMIKQRQESVELYEKGGRAELAAQERDEIDDHLGLSAEADVGRRDRRRDRRAGEGDRRDRMKDMGRVMAALKERYAGKLDFGKASAAVKKLLSGG